MAESSEPEQKENELELRIQELELRRAELQLANEFSKYGFAGTLIGGLAGMILVLALALLMAFANLELGTWGLLGIVFMILIGLVAFGYLSLRTPATIVAKFLGHQLSVTPPEQPTPPQRPSPE